MVSFLTSELFVEISTVVILLLSIGLSAVITQKFLAKRSKSLLYWGSGLWVFAVSVLIEVVFAFNVYSGFLAGAYLFLVAAIVELLALGSMFLVKNEKLRLSYIVFMVVTSVVFIYFLLTEQIPNLLTSFVVFNPNLPLGVLIMSSVITFPAAIILIVVAALSYMKKKSNKLLSIIAGVIVVSVAGTLYIVGFPAFLYYSEFIGILLLWYGFI
jgi:hypothetical protein